MNERCVKFGPDARLAGILSEPDTNPVERALVLVSAGLTAKSGPYRLYTELARRLAGDGVATLRFDLGGLGDSLPDRTGLDLKERTLAEVGAALDLVSERYAARDIVLGGLCSGAEDSFRTAAVDERVTGVVLIDPFAYRTRGWLLHDTLHRLERRTLRALGLYQPLRRPNRAGAEERRIVTYRYMERAESAPILRALIGRGAHVHFVYTGGVRDGFNHPSQFPRQFDDIELPAYVTLDHFPELDHTQLLRDDRRALIEAVAGRLREHSPAPS